MKRIVVFITILLISVSLYANPRLISDPSFDLEPGAVFQIMINEIEQPELYTILENYVDLDVQNYEGQKSIKIRYGNPWPGLTNTYKWSDWSESFVYTFPKKPAPPSGCSIK